MVFCTTANFFITLFRRGRSTIWCSVAIHSNYSCIYAKHTRDGESKSVNYNAKRTNNYEGGLEQLLYFIEEMRRSHGKQSLPVDESAAPLRPSITKFGANAITITVILEVKIKCHYFITKICEKHGLITRRVARNSQWGGCFGGLGAEPPAAGGQWGSGGEAPSRRRLGVWGQSPQPPEARGSGGEAPSARKFCIFFAKITSF